MKSSFSNNRIFLEKISVKIKYESDFVIKKKTLLDVVSKSKQAKDYIILKK
jgi:hypothetical protein